MSQDDQGNSLELSRPGINTSEPSFQSIFDELCDFRRDNIKMEDIKQEIKGVNDRLDEVEGRIEETEMVLQMACID